MGIFSRNTDQPAVENTDEVVAVVESQVEQYPEDGAIAHNSNDAPELIAASNDEANNPIVQGEVERDSSLDRQEKETQAEYNERVPVAVQPVQPAPTTSYLGQPL